MLRHPRRALSVLVPVAMAACSAPGTSNIASVDPGAAKVVVIVKFKSRYDADEIRRRYPGRMPQFRELEGLVQKYYLHEETTDEWAGVYFWDSAESVQAYLQSDLRKSIPEAYGVVGTPRVEVLQMVDRLRR